VHFLIRRFNNWIFIRWCNNEQSCYVSSNGCRKKLKGRDNIIYIITRAYIILADFCIYLLNAGADYKNSNRWEHIKGLLNFFNLSRLISFLEYTFIDSHLNEWKIAITFLSILKECNRAIIFVFLLKLLVENYVTGGRGPGMVQLLAPWK